MAQGSVKQFKAKDGTVSYRARADAGLDNQTGKRRQSMKTFHTKAEAQSWVREMQRRAERGEWATSRRVTLAQWVDEWLAGAGERGRKESSQRIYRVLLRGRVCDALGSVQLAKLTAARLEGFFHQQEQELKASSVSTIYRVLHVCLADAERLGAVAVNPLDKVRAPSVPHSTRHAWTPDEARRFLTTTRDDTDFALWLVLLTCGLRIGEALALKWDDCDFDAGRLHIRRTLTTDSIGKVKIGDSTKSGKPRTVPLVPALAAALREQRARVLALHMEHRDIWTDHDLCFPNPFGLSRTMQPVRVSLLTLCKSARVPALTPHGLRHTAASLLAELAPVAVARDMLGHASLTITNTYVHTNDKAKQAGSAALAELLTGS